MYLLITLLACKFFWIFQYVIISPANRDRLLLACKFSRLLALPRLSNAIVKEVVIVDTPVWLSTSQKSAQYFNTKYGTQVFVNCAGFSVDTFYQIEDLPIYCQFD